MSVKHVSVNSDMKKSLNNNKNNNNNDYYCSLRNRKDSIKDPKGRESSHILINTSSMKVKRERKF